MIVKVPLVNRPGSLACRYRALPLTDRNLALVHIIALIIDELFEGC